MLGGTHVIYRDSLSSKDFRQTKTRTFKEKNDSSRRYCSFDENICTGDGWLLIPSNKPDDGGYRWQGFSGGALNRRAGLYRFVVLLISGVFGDSRFRRRAAA